MELGALGPSGAREDVFGPLITALLGFVQAGLLSFTQG